MDEELTVSAAMLEGWAVWLFKHTVFPVAYDIAYSPPFGVSVSFSGPLHVPFGLEPTRCKIMQHAHTGQLIEQRCKRPGKGAACLLSDSPTELLALWSRPIICRDSAYVGYTLQPLVDRSRLASSAGLAGYIRGISIHFYLFAPRYMRLVENKP